MIDIEEKNYEKENNYNSDIYKNFEEDIEKYIRSYRKEHYNKIIEKDKRTNIVEIFSEMAANIIKWYPFEEKTELLEIGANYGEVTR